MNPGKESLTEMLKRYAQLVVEVGLNVQPGQLVQITLEVYQRQLALALVEACYQRGAKYVNLDFFEPHLDFIRIKYSSLEQMKYVPQYFETKYNELLLQGAANLRVVGAEEPDLLAALDPQKINTTRLARYQALRKFYEEGIGCAKVHWSVVAAATSQWGQKVFPDSTPQEAEEKLWWEIFRLCRLDQTDFLEAWKQHNEKLQQRAARLSELRLKELHFTGNGTDLRVGLSRKAKFKGGSTPGPRGVPFHANLPTEEVFSTPDWRCTNGRAVATRPFFINGKLIENLILDFKDGLISSYSATAGKETLATYLASDPGAKRLGEVALVGIDSPIYQSGLLYQETLFDENAACHIAIGSAYKSCLHGGAQLSAEELADLGCNESSVHTDIMISSEKVNVTGETWEGKKITLLVNGCWQEF